MTDCLFCRIGRHELAAHVVYEDAHALAFLDRTPRAPGHTMVIPKAHAPTIVDLPPEEVGPLFTAVKRVAEKLTRALGPQGMTIGINQGLVSGQTIDHLHVHLLPRFAADGGGSIHSVVLNPPKESPEAIAEKIRNA